MNANERKALARGRRDALKASGMLVHHKARRFPDRKKQASKAACRGRIR